MPGQAELARVYDLHADAIYAYALNLTRHDADARDLVQELFRRLADRPVNAGLRDERSWLLRSLHNLAVDTIRRRDSRERTRDRWAAEPATPFAPTSDPDEAAFRRELSEALGDLPPEQRAVVHLKLWEELTFEEIAQVLGVSPNTAASRYRYGLDKLRGRLRLLYDEIR
jgi:RNA polymerase sigma-70 factor, ECF subfamily